MPMLRPARNPLHLCNILHSSSVFGCVFYHVLFHLYRLLHILRWAKAGIMPSLIRHDGIQDSDG